MPRRLSLRIILLLVETRHGSKSHFYFRENSFCEIQKKKFGAKFHKNILFPQKDCVFRKMFSPKFFPTISLMLAKDCWKYFKRNSSPKPGCYGFVSQRKKKRRLLNKCFIREVNVILSWESTDLNLKKKFSVKPASFHNNINFIFS